MPGPEGRVEPLHPGPALTQFGMALPVSDVGDAGLGNRQSYWIVM